MRYGINKVSGERTYPIVDGVAYVDLFQYDILTDYTGEIKKAFNGQFNGMEYFNELHFVGKCRPKYITLEASWGSKCFMQEIKQLLDWLEENTFEDSMDNAAVKSLKIEDFSITQGTVEETEKSKLDSLMGSFSFYIRNPIILGVSPEWKDDYRHF